MWCDKCKLETESKQCPLCGSQTAEFVPTQVYYCHHCQSPVILKVNEEKPHCPVCGSKVLPLAADVRPVFPEERVLLGRLDKRFQDLQDKSVWAAHSRYYVDGKPLQLTGTALDLSSLETVREGLEAAQADAREHGEQFERQIELFCRINAERLTAITAEAQEFVRTQTELFKKKHSTENVVLSFSGGKDSTVIADVVSKALSNPNLLHIFVDTTLEFPSTLEYVERYRKDHPFSIFIRAKNEEQDFFKVAADIGPPARLIRWCCSMFKTGPINRELTGAFRSQPVLTYYGVRSAESVSRSKYKRVEDQASEVKISRQTVAAPIFPWSDLEVWLYILSNKLDFNDAYRLGYERVGCWLCPNNNSRDVFLSRLYLKEQAGHWRDFLIDFARRIGKEDAEIYVDEGSWRARQGGNGLQAAQDVKIKFRACTAEEQAQVFSINRPFDDTLVGLFVPFGRLAPELGRKILGEVIVVDVSDGTPLLSLQPFNPQDSDGYGVKIRVLGVRDNYQDLLRLCGYQIRKFNACRQCLKCEAVCPQGAIRFVQGRYTIDPRRCLHIGRCGKCVDQKVLPGGCLMDKYLRTKPSAVAFRNAS